jgi:hypothetical protein
VTVTQPTVTISPPAVVIPPGPNGG